jgi:glycine hydroxymethyltransferase
VNKNTVPNEKRSPFITSGIRIGTPAMTTRGLKEAEMTILAGWIRAVIESKGDESKLEMVRGEVLELCRKFPVYGEHHAV